MATSSASPKAPEWAGLPQVNEYASPLAGQFRYAKQVVRREALAEHAAGEERQVVLQRHRPVLAGSTGAGRRYRRSMLLRARTIRLQPLPSMLRDLEAGRKCEVESLNGYLQDMASQAGVAAPVNDQVTKIIRDIQDGRRKPEFTNLDLLELPPLESYFG